MPAVWYVYGPYLQTRPRRSTETSEPRTPFPQNRVQGGLTRSRATSPITCTGAWLRREYASWRSCWWTPAPSSALRPEAAELLLALWTRGRGPSRGPHFICPRRRRRATNNARPGRDRGTLNATAMAAGGRTMYGRALCDGPAGAPIAPSASSSPLGYVACRCDQDPEGQRPRRAGGGCEFCVRALGRCLSPRGEEAVAARVTSTSSIPSARDLVIRLRLRRQRPVGKKKLRAGILGRPTTEGWMAEHMLSSSSPPDGRSKIVTGAVPTPAARRTWPC